MSLKAVVSEVRSLLAQLSVDSATRICLLPSMGSKKTEKVVELRSDNGDRVLKLADVTSVRGMGAVTLSKMTGGDRTATARVVNYCNYYRSHYQQEVVSADDKIVSIDLGWENSAYICLTPELEVEDWRRVNLGAHQFYSPEDRYDQVRKFLDELPKATVYLLESQFHRPVPRSMAFLNVCLRQRILEAMVYCVARERKLRVCRVSPQKVSNYFQLYSKRTKYYHKKQLAVVRTSQLVGAGGLKQIATPLGGKIEVPATLLNDYWNEKKQDDLSDCLLQAVAFLEWARLADL